jgi:hypothetical protein
VVRADVHSHVAEGDDLGTDRRSAGDGDERVVHDRRERKREQADRDHADAERNRRHQTRSVAVGERRASEPADNRADIEDDQECDGRLRRLSLDPWTGS